MELILELILELIIGVLYCMAKKTRITRVESLSLTKALSNAKIVHKIAEYKSPGVLARILLETFLFEDGKITAEWFLREKVCIKGTFTKLRDRLIKDQFLYFREEVLSYFPGVRLKPHLDAIRKVKAATLADIQAMDEKKADKSELEITRMQLEKTKAKVEEIAIAVAELQAAMLPPDSEIKQEIRTRSTIKIASLACKN